MSIQISSDLTHFALLKHFLGAYKPGDILVFKCWLCMLGQWAMDVTIKISFGGGAPFVPVKADQCYMKPKKP